ncbi:MAG: ATP-dependent chaperone ClpB, partial [Eggerthellaceae bacterium]|nr:ATP-dependent chaperone ClpB [Eggerthellaceae bacterium]
MNMANLQKLALTAQEAMQKAMEIASDAEAAQAEPVHLLKALLTGGENNLNAIIKRIGADAGTIMKNCDAEIARMPKVKGGGMMMQGTPSMAFLNVLDSAVKTAEKLGDSYATSEHLLIALSEDKGAAGKILTPAGVTHKNIEAAYTALRGDTRVDSQTEKAQFEALEQYGQNL